MALWLTRITPNPRSADARADLADLGGLHRRLMRLMPPDGLGDSPRQAAGLLFRVDQSRAGTAILAQSAHSVDPSGLPAGYGRVESRDLTPLLDHLAIGQRIRYRILANPTKRVGRSKEYGTQETTTPLRGADADAWWRTRAQDNGLAPQSIITHDRDDAMDRSRGRRIRHAAVLFQGVAAVTDAEAVRAAVRGGIGRGKSHGCGLLSLALIGDSE